MSKIIWNSTLSLGIESIDNEHKRLIEISNNLVDLVRIGKIQESKILFHELREYTVTHFNNEETYMLRVKYPNLEKHKAEHSELKKSVKIFQDDLYRQQEIRAEEVYEFIKHWLIDHVLYSDMNIKKFLAQAPEDAKNKSGNGVHEVLEKDKA
jgi:hemerythrin-like metal-binding protein